MMKAKYTFLARINTLFYFYIQAHIILRNPIYQNITLTYTSIYIPPQNPIPRGYETLNIVNTVW